MPLLTFTRARTPIFCRPKTVNPVSMATATGAQATSLSSANIRNTDVHTNPGVDLNDQQKLVVGSILDVSFSRLL